MKTVTRTGRRLLSMFLAVLVLLGGISAGALAAEDGTAAAVYVSAASGSDENPGTAESPVATLPKAYELLISQAPEAGVIDISGEVSAAADYHTPDHAFPITLTSSDGTGNLALKGSLYLGGDTTIQDITVTNTVSKLRYLIAQCHALTIGENVDCVPGGTYYLNLVGGAYNGSITGDARVTVASGTWNNVYGGSYNSSSYYNANWKDGGCDLTGSISVNVTGGTITTLAGGMFFGKATGDVDVSITGGEILGVDADSKGVYAAGIYGSVGGDVTLTVQGSSADAVDIRGSVYGGTRGIDTSVLSTVSGDVTVSITGATVGGSITAGGAFDSYSNRSTAIEGTASVALAAPLTLNGKVTADTFDGGADGALTLGSAASLTVTGAVTGSAGVTVTDPVDQSVYLTAPSGTGDAAFSYLNTDGSTLTAVDDGTYKAWTMTAEGGSGSAGVTLTLVVPDEATAFMLFASSYNQSGTSIRLPAYTLNEDGRRVYTLPGMTAGVYCYRINGDGYYNLTKPFVITAADAAAGVKTVTPELVPMAGNKWETYTTDTNNTLRYTTDAVAALFSTDGLTMDGSAPYESIHTPALSPEKAGDEYTTQDEMMAWISGLAEDTPYMHVYSLGTTAYGNDVPLVLFTSADIPESATLEEAAAIVTRTGKPIVQYTAQIHGNEPSGGDGALLMLQAMAGGYDATFDQNAVLSSMELYVIPRVNPDGAEDWVRRNPISGDDMNRDHLLALNPEIEMVHTAYNLFEPEVAIDGHEFSGGFRTEGDVSADENGVPYLTNLDDVRISPSGSLNSDSVINEKCNEMTYQAFADCADAGLRVYDYGATVANVNGRAYYGLLNSYSFLIETRGIYLSKTVNFERRVFAQYSTVKSMLGYVEAHGEEIVSNVSRARAETARRGLTYRQDNLLVLESDKSGAAGYTLPRPSYYFDGTEQNARQESTFYYYDKAVRTRTAPTAYVFPMGQAWAETVKHGLESSGADIYVLEPGTTVELQQYQQTVTGSDNQARLTAVMPVTFENGAYLVPMDQSCAMAIAMMLEPDVTDTTSECSLTALGILTADESGSYPLYRCIADDPRSTVLGIASFRIVGPNGEMTAGFEQEGGVVQIQGATAIGEALFVPANTTLPYWRYAGWTFRAEKDGETETFGTVATLTQALNSWILEKLQEGGWSFTMDSKTPGVYEPSSGGSSGGGAATYPVTAAAVRDGSVSVSPRSAARGATVTVTAVPDVGFQLAEITAKDAKGSAVKLTDRGDGRYTFPMPASAVTVTASFVRPPDDAGTAFTDVSADAYYSGAVEWAVEQGITNGTTASTFSPDAACTRGQAVTFLWRAAGSPAPKSTVNPFSDVAADAFCHDAVLWAVEQGITKGTTETTFTPGAAVTRGQMVTFLYRAAGSPAVTSAAAFADVPADAYCSDAVLWAVAQGITQGVSATAFCPDASCTRAQMVTFLFRAAS